MVTITDTETIKKLMKRLKESGCVVKEDYQAGTVEAKDGDATVYRGVQMYKDSWMVRYEETDRIKFK